MAGYGRNDQVMDEEWHIARKVDRLDMGGPDMPSRFNRLVIIFGLVRAIWPKDQNEEEEKERQGDKFVPIEAVLQRIDETIKGLRSPKDAQRLRDIGLDEEIEDLESTVDGIWYDLAEVIRRGGLMKKVRAQEEIVR
jgi:hypothetical protein